MTTSTTDTAGRGPALPGQTVVVIGGSSGIGLETARKARAEGAEVVLVGRDPGHLERAAAEVGASRTAAFDATDSEALKRFFADLPAPIDHVMVTGPGPYYELRPMLFSGSIGSTNYERYKSTATDALFNQYSGATPAQQLSIIHQISTVMAQDLPVIPVVEGVDWYQYDTSSFGGWPTQSDPYAQPPVWATPDNGVVLTKLYPVS